MFCRACSSSGPHILLLLHAKSLLARGFWFRTPECYPAWALMREGLRCTRQRILGQRSRLHYNRRRQRSRRRSAEARPALLNDIKSVFHRGLQGGLARAYRNTSSVAISYLGTGSVSPSTINETSQVEIGPWISGSSSRRAEHVGGSSLSITPPPRIPISGGRRRWMLTTTGSADAPSVPPAGLAKGRIWGLLVASIVQIVDHRCSLRVVGIDGALAGVGGESSRPTARVRGDRSMCARSR